jgi:hypothetical protein
MTASRTLDSNDQLSSAYDNLWRLTNETIAGTTATNGSIAYAYDNVGNVYCGQPRSPRSRIRATARTTMIACSPTAGTRTETVGGLLQLAKNAKSGEGWVVSFGYSSGWAYFLAGRAQEQHTVLWLELLQLVHLGHSVRRVWTASCRCNPGSC